MTPEEKQFLEGQAAALAALLAELVAIKALLTRPRNGAISGKIVDVAATTPAKSETVEITGSWFLCTSASAAFDIQFGDGEKFPAVGGLVLNIPGGFKRVTIYNRSSLDVLTVEFIASNCPISFTGLIGG